MCVAAGTSPGAELSARITRAPPLDNICVNGMYTVAPGGASRPPSPVLPITPTMLRQSPLIG
jgi:hypothetical protein